jgi:hypothetical protein
VSEARVFIFSLYSAYRYVQIGVYGSTTLARTAKFIEAIQADLLYPVLLAKIFRLGAPQGRFIFISEFQKFT